MQKYKQIFIISMFGIFFSLSASVQTKIPTEEEFIQIIRTQGIAKAVDMFKEVRREHPEAIIFRASTLDSLAYSLEWNNEMELEKAIDILKLNREAYPNTANVYDSLAEAYMIHGDTQLAIRNFRKSMELQPERNRGEKYAYILENYEKFEYFIPMRDGVKLYTQIYTPRDKGQKYPFLLERDAYSIGNYQKNRYRYRYWPTNELMRDGYIFVYQDIRGKYKSEGEFVVMKPFIPDKKSPQDTDESSDVYDTVEWLLKNIPNHNSRVGLWGGSYSGWLTIMGMLDAHPALKAFMPAAPPSDMWIGDDFHHNGAFRLIYTFDWIAQSAQPRTGPTERRNRRFNYGTRDGYQFFLDIGPITNVNKKYFHNSIPTWNEYIKHGDYDEYWQKRNCLKYLNNIAQPTLIVAAWFDAEDFYGPMSAYCTIEKNNPKNKTSLVVGPWLHGGWLNMDGDSLGKIQFGEKTGDYFRKTIELPFYQYYLKDKGELKLPEALVFETGSNQWKSYDQWPPRGTSEKNIYLKADGQLSFSKLTKESNNNYDSYISDPHNPVPWSTSVQNNQGHLWMVEDQRFAAKRPDVLVYQSDILTEDITIAGPIIADLFVSTTGTDADWVVKLIDVYPKDAPNEMGDYQMLLAGEVLRCKYRTSFSDPEPMIPDKVTEISFDLRDRHHCFRKGHKIMVQIQSTWFPVIDRNPQIFVDIYNAKEEDFQIATHKVYRSKKYPSSLKVRVLNSSQK